MSLQPATNEQLQKVLNIVNEGSPEKRDASIAHVRTWLKLQPHLPQNIDERMLLSFVRGCKHDLTRTKNKLDAYYTSRAEMPELFADRDPRGDDVQSMLSTMDVFPMERLTPGGCRVTFHRFRDLDPTAFSARTCFKFVFMLGDIRTLEEGALAGDVFLFDMKGMTLGHLARLAMPVLRRMLFCAQEAYPQRLQQIHLFNVPNYIDRLLALFRPLMKEKMRNRFLVHSDHEALLEHVPRECLPNEYGGCAGTIDDLKENWRAKFEDYRDWFLEQESVVADLSRRPSKTGGCCSQEFGVDGSFRKLAID